MGLLITRDHDGNVTIANPVTGKSETIATGVAGRPAQRTLGSATALPAHSWSQLQAASLPSHSWSQLA